MVNYGNKFTFCRVFLLGYFCVLIGVFAWAFPFLWISQVLYLPTNTNHNVKVILKSIINSSVCILDGICYLGCVML